jgi:hypothetical protein
MLAVLVRDKVFPRQLRISAMKPMYATSMAGLLSCRRFVVALLCLVVAGRTAAQEVTVEFENFFGDMAMFDEYTALPGPLISGGSNVGVGSTGGLTLPGKHALTYTPLSFAFAAHGDAVTTSAFFKTGALAPPTGFNEIIGQVYITSATSGNPHELFGSNDFFASVYRDSSSEYLGISGQTSSGSFYPFLATDVSLASNRWYELSATFTRNQQTTLNATFRVTDYGSSGLTSQGVIGTTTTSFSNQAANFADATWYGGFGADADNGVKADRFRLDVPGNIGGPTTVSIEPTYDVTYWPGSTTRFFEGEPELSIDGGDVQFPVLKALAEFELGEIPVNAEVTSASLIIEPTFSQTMTVRAMGYAGDGDANSADPPSLLRFMGQSTGALQAGVDKVIDLDEAYIETLLGSSSHLALLMESTTVGPYTFIVASEAPTGTPPTLVIEYTLPPANGDFDGNDVVDGKDFLIWQRGQSPRPNSAADLAEWRSNFGRTGVMASSATVPEPTGILLVAAIPFALKSRRLLPPFNQTQRVDG